MSQAKSWLTDSVVPVWSGVGIDREGGGFSESLSLQGKRVDDPKRALVQARQIYSFRVAMELGVCAPALARECIEQGRRFLIDRYRLPSGGFRRSIDRAGNPVETRADLYTQAFVLFALAHAEAVTPNPENRERAQELLNYLLSERKLPSGGFSELAADESTLYVSNPHMHLFEAALAWMETEPSNPAWGKLADTVFELCQTRLIDPATGLLAEYFDSEWNILREKGDPLGRFVWEPGHQFEWAWLLGRYAKKRGLDLRALRERMITHAETSGICAVRRAPFDEMWSDHTPKSSTARLWPHCERIKASVFMALERRCSQSAMLLSAADEAMERMFRYFEVEHAGVWLDIWNADGSFVQGQPARASSLYHVIGAIQEYTGALTAPRTGSSLTT